MSTNALSSMNSPKLDLNQIQHSLARQRGCQSQDQSLGIVDQAQEETQAPVPKLVPVKCSGGYVHRSASMMEYPRVFIQDRKRPRDLSEKESHDCGSRDARSPIPARSLSLTIKTKQLSLIGISSSAKKVWTDLRTAKRVLMTAPEDNSKAYLRDASPCRFPVRSIYSSDQQLFLLFCSLCFLIGCPTLRSTVALRFDALELKIAFAV